MLESRKDMKKLVVYYSYSGNTKFIAETMANEIEADILELIPKKKMNASGMGMLGWGIRQLISKSERELMPLNYDLREYDLVIIGTPVWSYTLVPPIRTFLKEQALLRKNIAVFCCHGGDKRHTLEDMTAGMPQSNCVGKIDFMDPLTVNTASNVKKAQKWAKAIVKQFDN